MLIIESHPDKIEEYERKLRLHEDVIRFMTVKIKTFDGKQSIMVETNNDENYK
jgi:ribosomal protein S6